MKRTTFLIVLFVLLGTAAVQAQELFTYTNHWTLPRSAFQAVAESNADTAFEALVADGTIVHWGNDTPFVHRADGTTHGAWFTATSLEGIDKALSALQAGATGPNPLQANATDHHDHYSVSLLHGGTTANIESGYMHTSTYRLKDPGDAAAWMRYAEASYKEVFDELVADGTVAMWELSRELIHTGDVGGRVLWYVVPDAASHDKVRERLAKAREDRPGPWTAMRAAIDPATHRDFLSHVRFQHK